MMSAMRHMMKIGKEYSFDEKASKLGQQMYVFPCVLAICE